jgi:glyoxylase-like metal-dependent hydrolase (beta-lactamase superfamily II)
MQEFIHPLSDDFKNIYFIEGDRKGNYPFSHSLLIGNYLIDTGISSGRLRKLKRQFQINTVILSHWHEDHISGNNLFSNSNFLCHINDKPPIEDIEKMFPYYRVEGTDAGKEFRILFEMFGMNNTIISNIIKDDEIINIDDLLKLKVVHTPGHTAGHCAFYEANSKIAFFGDIDLTRFPYYATIDSDLVDYENSIEILKNLEFEVAVLGHRDPVFGSSNIQAELEKFKSVIFKRDERILSNLSEQNPIRPIDLKGKNLIYKRYSYDFEVISELVMIEKHFDKFLRNRLITIKDNGYILN